MYQKGTTVIEDSDLSKWLLYQPWTPAIETDPETIWEQGAVENTRTCNINFPPAGSGYRVNFSCVVVGEVGEVGRSLADLRDPWLKWAH
jgi:hypothetical protein